MRNKPSDSLRRIVLGGAVAMIAPAMTAPAQAQQTPAGEVAVAIVDSNIRRIDFDDPNVRIVDMTPKAPEGASFMKYKVNDFYSHGDIVASSFVREYRKLDPSARIVIYTVDPFIRKDGNVSANFSMAILNQALPRMRDAGVRVAVTAFGISDPTAGGRIADAFSRNGMSLFAAIPNEPHDKGIYPAASPGVVSVADTSRKGAFSQDRKFGTWVSVMIDGGHGSAHNISDADGTSFAVAHAAAYGTYVLARRPETPVAELLPTIRSHGVPVGGAWAGRPITTTRIGGSAMIQSMTAAYGTGTTPVRSVAKGPESMAVIASLGEARTNGR